MSVISISIIIDLRFNACVHNFFIESPANGVVESLSEVQNSVSVAQQHDPPSTSGTPRPTRPPLRPSRNHVHGPILGS
ncbi:hypothetical protein AHAS_Ahas17G0167200 [Arachis hypogaea]